MKKIVVGEATVFASAETLAEHRANAADIGTSLTNVLHSLVDRMFYDRLPSEVRTFFNAWHHRHPGIAVLDAHGTRDRGIWKYQDNGRLHDIRSWVASVDGEYGSVVLLVCDEPMLNNLPKTTKSILFTPDAVVSCGLEAKLGGMQHHFQIAHPTYGEIDAYVADHARKELLSTP